MRTCWPTRNFGLLKRCFARFPTHLIQDREDVGVAHVGGYHTCGGRNCCVVPPGKFGQDIYTFIRVLIGEISVHFITQSSADTLHDSAFDVRISRLEILHPRFSNV